jgi:hypothetical protein
VALVRRLYEGTALTYLKIAAETRVAAASVCRWAQAGGWQRPASAPKATSIAANGVPSSALRGRALARRLREVAERWLDEMEREPAGEPHDLAWVLEMLRAARAEDATARADPPGRRFVVPSVPPDVLAREAAVAAEQRRQKRLRMAQSGPRRPRKPAPHRRWTKG